LQGVASAPVKADRADRAARADRAEWTVTDWIVAPHARPAVAGPFVPTRTFSSDVTPSRTFDHGRLTSEAVPAVPPAVPRRLISDQDRRAPARLRVPPSSDDGYHEQSGHSYRRRDEL